MRRALVVGIFSLAVAAVPATAMATSITQFVSFSGGVLDIRNVTPFDPSLGTLTSVSVGITGTLTVSGSTMPNILGFPPTPQPYSYTVSVDQSFDGLVGKYFDFASPATFQFQGNDPGVGQGYSFTTLFTYGFSFTATTDITGLTLPTTSSSVGALIPPPGGIGGLRSDFLQTVVPLDQIQMTQSASISVLGAPPAPPPSSFVTNAQMQIDYNYTPVTAAAVPEPGTLALLAAGLVTMAVRLRKAPR